MAKHRRMKKTGTALKLDKLTKKAWNTLKVRHDFKPYWNQQYLYSEFIMFTIYTGTRMMMMTSYPYWPSCGYWISLGTFWINCLKQIHKNASVQMCPEFRIFNFPKPSVLGTPMLKWQILYDRSIQYLVLSTVTGWIFLIYWLKMVTDCVHGSHSSWKAKFPVISLCNSSFPCVFSQ